MPLTKGRSKKTARKNTSELIHSYKRTGRIGSSKPASLDAAVKQAYAIAMKKAGRSRR